MSATALLLKDSGVRVTGSDEEVYPPISDILQKEGLQWMEPYAPENIPSDADTIVIGKNAKLTAEHNEEVREATRRGVTILSFPEVLAKLSEGHTNVVIAGSYGKSSVAALLAHCLESAGRNPSYFIGASPTTPSRSARLKDSKELFILEGDEYPSSNTDQRSKFLHYHPQHLIITPLAHDHFNIFPTVEKYLGPFKELVKLLPPDGVLLVCEDGELSPGFLESLGREAITYGLRSGMWRGADIHWGDITTFTLVNEDTPVITLETALLGEHNIENIVGVAAFLLSQKLLSPEDLQKGIASFKSLRRRLDKKSDKTSVNIYEGFGSSYEKAVSAIAAMKLHFKERLVVIFEPHTINWRRRETLTQYDDVFSGAEKVLLLKPAGKEFEVPLEEIAEHARMSVPDVQICVSAKDCLEKLQLNADDVVLLLSSGNFDGLIPHLLSVAEMAFPQ